MIASAVPSPARGESVKLRIDSLAFGGEGVARLDGRVFFTAHVAVGELVEAKITECKKNFARARVTKVIEPSPHRVVPPCLYYQRCGGCQYQHLDYAEELRAKEDQVRELFARMAKMRDAPVLPIMASAESYGYRNRLTVHAAHGLIGFHQANSREIIDVEACLLAESSVNEALQTLRSSQPADGHYSVRAREIPPSAFFQANGFQLEALRALVKKSLAPFGETLVEAYCGGGFFTEVLAADFLRIIGIEQDSRALRDAERLSLKNAQWIAGRVEDHLAAVLQNAKSSQVHVLADPPREGLAENVISALRQNRVEKLVYVSCNPSTLARDAARLHDKFILVEVQPIDLFPRTAHIETVSTWISR